MYRKDGDGQAGIACFRIAGYFLIMMMVMVMMPACSRQPQEAPEIVLFDSSGQMPPEVEKDAGAQQVAVLWRAVCEESAQEDPLVYTQRQTLLLCVLL